MRKAIEEAKKFVCTTKDRIVKDAKEFIQNVDWKKVAIGVAGTLAVAAVVVATGGAAAPVLIGAAAGAGISTGTTVVSGVIQGKSPAEIAKDASGAFMWGAIGGAVGGGTTEVFKDVGSNVLGKVGKKLVGDGVDMALDLTQTATENGGLTGKDVLFSAVTSFGGDLVGAAKTNSTVRNQLIDGATDNRAIKDAVGDSLTDNKAVKNAIADSATDNKAVKNATENIKGPYSYLEDSASVAEGKSFTAAQKKKIIEENKNKNGGVIKSDLSGEVLVPATKNTKGVTPNPSEVNIDHIFPKSAGGTNSYSNAQVLSRAENIAKSNKY